MNDAPALSTLDRVGISQLVSPAAPLPHPGFHKATVRAGDEAGVEPAVDLLIWVTRFATCVHYMFWGTRFATCVRLRLNILSHRLKGVVHLGFLLMESLILVTKNIEERWLTRIAGAR